MWLTAEVTEDGSLAVATMTGVYPGGCPAAATNFDMIISLIANTIVTSSPQAVRREVGQLPIQTSLRFCHLEE